MKISNRPSALLFGEQLLSFHMTGRATCPYLPNRQERKIFTELLPPHAEALHTTLTHMGFRRSQNIAYRPACEACFKCIPARVVVDEFVITKRWRRVLKRNKNIVRNALPLHASLQQHNLLKRYLSARHPGGNMSDMSIHEYAAMVENSPIHSLLFEYRESEATHAPLIGTVLCDTIADGLSMMYSFFDPDKDKDSLGSYMILDHILYAKELGVPYIYLGFWVEGSKQMGYKADFQPLEVLIDEQWQPFPKMEYHPD